MPWECPGEACRLLLTDSADAAACVADSPCGWLCYEGAVAGGNAGTEFKQEVAKAVSKGSTQDSRKDTVSLADIDKWQEDDSSGAAVDKKSDKPTTTKSTSKKASSSTTATAVPTEQVTEAGGAAAATGTTEVVADTTAKPTEQAVLPSSNAAITPAGEAKPVTGECSMLSAAHLVQLTVCIWLGGWVYHDSGCTARSDHRHALSAHTVWNVKFLCVTHAACACCAGAGNPWVCSKQKSSRSCPSVTPSRRVCQVQA